MKTSRFCHYIHNIVIEVIINVTNRAGPRGFVYWGCGGRALKAEGVNRAGRAGMGGRREWEWGWIPLLLEGVRGSSHGFFLKICVSENAFHYTPRKLCLWWVYCFHLRPSVRPSVTFCFFDILKGLCWIFIKPCEHVHISKTNTLDKKVRARGQFY